MTNLLNLPCGQWVGLRDEELPEGETYDFDRGVRWAERYLKQKAVPSDYLDGHQQEPVAWMDSEGRFSYFKHLDSDEPLYAAPVHARPVVHEVRCTYPQCQATNGCVGVCSKTEPVQAIDMSEKHLHELDKLKEKNT